MKDRRAPFHLMAKPTGPLCNLNCSYCYYLKKEKLYGDSPPKDWRMADDLLDHFIKSYLQSQPPGEVLFVWQGGEPSLCGLGFFKRVLELQRKHNQGNQNKEIRNSFQTNGTFLKEDWARFFATEGWLVGLSIDGPRELHDANRLYKGGKPSFDWVLRGIDLLRDQGVEFNTLSTINAANVRHPQEVYNFLKEIGSTFLQFLPVVEPLSPYGENGTLSPQSISPQGYSSFLTALFDQWIQGDVGEVFVQNFEVALQAWSGRSPSLCVHAPVCGGELVLERNGDIYSCDHFVSPAYRLGNILQEELQDLVQGEKQRAFGLDKLQGLCSRCRNCRYLPACNGDCPKHRFVPEGNGRISHLCQGGEGLLRYFHHIEPFMEHLGRLILEGRPAREGMEFARLLLGKGP